jgi:hypothetical protein
MVFIRSGRRQAHDNSSVILTQELNARHRTPDTRDLTPETSQQGSPLERMGVEEGDFLKGRDFHTDRLSHLECFVK